MSGVNKIPESWVETTLGEVIYISSGKSRPKNGGSYPVYGGNGILDYADNYNYENETIIIGRVGAYCGCVYFEVNKFWLSDNALCIKSNDKSNIKFLYYFLIYQNLNKKSIGGAQPLLTQGILNQIEIVVPKDLAEQKAIANILTAFDDKIQLLQQQNNTLETIAQTIFTEWFGKYQLGDELPNRWRVGKLEEIANHSKTNIKPFDNPCTEYYHYSLPSYDNGLIPIIEKGEMIKSNKYLVESNSFLVSKLNPFTPRIWTIFYAQQNSICSTEFQVVKPKDELYFSLIHCFLNSNEFTSELSQKIKGTSSSHQRVNPQDIFDVELVIPSENDLKNFNSAIYPLLSKKNINHKQIQTLTQTRDILLPKLMSGQVRAKM